MKTILTKYPQTHIAFVNIDVEGWEKQVLESFDFNMVRPEVFAIESTEPDTEQLQSICRKILFENKYAFAMTDYLNRYYVDMKNQNAVILLQRFNYIGMCVAQSKVQRGFCQRHIINGFVRNKRGETLRGLGESD